MMTIAEGLLAEFEQELNTTRRCLERIPEDQLDWKPYDRSMTTGILALHIATTPHLVLGMVVEDEVPLPDFEGMAQPGSKAEILNALEEGAKAVREQLPLFDDARMQATWRLLKDGREVLALPRVAFLRAIMLNHWYHHRGQLTVYLRGMGVDVPSVYGASADEKPEFMK